MAKEPSTTKQAASAQKTSSKANVNASKSKEPKLTASQHFLKELRGYAEALVIAYIIVTFLFTTVGVVGSSMRPNLDGGSGRLPQALWQGDRVFIPKFDTWLRRANILPNYAKGEIVVVREPKNAPSYFNRKSQGCTTFLWFDQCRPFFIKRLIASEGDSLKIVNGQVFVNGVEMDQSYITGTGEITAYPVNFPLITVKNGVVTDFAGPIQSNPQLAINAEGQLLPDSLGRPTGMMVNSSVDDPINRIYYGLSIDALAPLPANVADGEFVHEIIIPKGYYFVMGDNRSNGGSEDSRYFGPIPTISVAGKASAVIWPPMREGKSNWRMLTIPEAFKTLPNP